MYLSGCCRVPFRLCSWLSFDFVDVKSIFDTIRFVSDSERRNDAIDFTIMSFISLGIYTTRIFHFTVIFRGYVSDPCENPYKIDDFRKSKIFGNIVGRLQIYNHFFRSLLLYSDNLFNYRIFVLWHSILYVIIISYHTIIFYSNLMDGSRDRIIIGYK